MGVAGEPARERVDIVDFRGAANVAAEIVAAVDLWFLGFAIGAVGDAVGAGKPDQYFQSDAHF